MTRTQAKLFPAVGQRLIELDDDELIVIRFARARVTSDTEWEIIVVNDTDVFVIEDDDIFDGVKWECEMKSRAHVASQDRLRESVRIFDIHEIDGAGFLDRLSGARQFNLEDLFESFKIALGRVALDHQTMGFIE